MYWVSEVEHNEAKRVQVSFTDRQWRLIEKLKGEMGMSESEIVRNIVLAWLSEKSLISAVVKSEKLNKST